MNRSALPESPRLLLCALIVAAFVAAPSPAQQTSCHPGVYQLARGDYAGALRSLSASSSTVASDAGLLNDRGVAELLNNNLTAAKATFTAALARDPQLLDARFNLGIVALRQNDFDTAANAFEAVWSVDASPLRARAAYHHALADDRRGHLDAAEAWLRKSLTADPDLGDAKLYLGVVLERQKHFADAGAVYKDFLAAHPDSTVAMLRFGVVALRAGFPDSARRYLKLVVQQAPGSVDAVEAQKYLLLLE